MRVDLIESWPQHLDYPLHRKFIHENRDKFEKVIVVLTNMNTGKDYREWLQQELNKDGVISISNDVVLSGQDWRDVAVNKALSISDSEWVYFTEQDFFPENDFWDPVETLFGACDAFGFFQEKRLHPCCTFMKRSLLNTTSRYFGVVKDKLDHFGQLQKEIEDREIPIGMISEYYGRHMNGLSQNMYLLQIGEKPNFLPGEFKKYCKKCLELESIHPEIKSLMESYV